MVCSVLYFSLIFLSIKEILLYPVGFELFNSADLGYQLFNSSDLLVYQQYDLVEDKKSKRNKRWLEEFYSYFYDSSEEDSSSEEEEEDNDDSSDYKLSDNNSNNKNAYGLCHDCILTYNQVHQVQHINRVIHSDTLNSSSTTPINTYEIKATLTTPKPRKRNNPQGKTIVSNEITTFAPTTIPTIIQPKTSMTAGIITVSDTQTPIEAVQITTKVSETPKQDITTTAVTVAPTTILTLVTTEATTAVTEPNT